MSSGYVVCASCGARIRADRDWCLRCDSPLVAAPAAAPAATRRDYMTIAGVAGTLAVLIAIGVVVRPRRDAEPTASPAAAEQRSPRAAAAAGGGSSSDYTPATAAESTRIATAAFKNGDFESARASFEQAVAKNPNDPEAVNNLGETLAHLKRTPEAIEQFTRAISIAPDRWAYHFNLAHALGEQARWDDAIVEYQRATELFPEDYATQFNLGMALHKKGDDRAAVSVFQKAIELAPGEATFHISLGQSFEKLGQIDEAKREYAQYLALDADGPDAARVKAHLDALNGAPNLAAARQQ